MILHFIEFIHSMSNEYVYVQIFVCHLYNKSYSFVCVSSSLCKVESRILALLAHT